MKLTDFDRNDAGSDPAERRKRLFLEQAELLDTFLERRAIDERQYGISYGGLITKMKISEEELLAWGRKPLG